jgi:tRNA A37 methylthiotransferase MiaB
MGRTRTNKIVLFESAEDCVGRFVDVRIERATGFSLYGTPVTLAQAATIAA